jgi:hypothetical protein
MIRDHSPNLASPIVVDGSGTSSDIHQTTLLLVNAHTAYASNLYAMSANFHSLFPPNPSMFTLSALSFPFSPRGDSSTNLKLSRRPSLPQSCRYAQMLQSATRKDITLCVAGWSRPILLPVLPHLKLSRYSIVDHIRINKD